RSFTYPFRGAGLGGRWLAGVALVAFLPVTFPAVFGYAVGCARAAAADPSAPPPAWRIGRRLLADGAWSALQAAVLTAPFAFGAWLLGRWLVRSWRPSGDAFQDAGFSWIVAVAVAALPWG